MLNFQSVKLGKKKAFKIIFGIHVEHLTQSWRTSSPDLLFVESKFRISSNKQHTSKLVYEKSILLIDQHKQKVWEFRLGKQANMRIKNQIRNQNF
jgi:hypothetical protein